MKKIVFNNKKQRRLKMSFSNSKCAQKADEFKRIDPPNNKKLPFFTYGFFKPHQLAYHQIKRYVEGKPKHSIVKADLIQVNGIPVLLDDEYETVEGYIIKFKKAFRDDAYREIGYSKSRGIYEWKEMDIEGTPANVLVASKPHLFDENGGGYDNFYFDRKVEDEKRKINVKSYDWRKDPMLRQPLIYIDNFLTANEAIQENKEEYEKFLEFIINDSTTNKKPKITREYKEFLELQMLYMLLWSSIDRFLSLRYGEIKKNNVISLSEEKAFQTSLKKHVRGINKIHSSRDLQYYILDPKKPACSAMFYYTLRNNVVHSGKILYEETELLRESLIQLFNIFSDVVEAAKNE